MLLRKEWNDMKFLKKMSVCLLLFLFVVISMFSMINSDKVYVEDYLYDGKSFYYNSCD